MAVEDRIYANKHYNRSNPDRISKGLKKIERWRYLSKLKDQSDMECASCRKYRMDNNGKTFTGTISRPSILSTLTCIVCHDTDVKAAADGRTIQWKNRYAGNHDDANKLCEP